MKRKLTVLLGMLLIFSLLVWSVPAAAASPSDVPPAQNTSAMPPVIVVSGSNYEMGYQYGEQAAPLIYRNLAILKSNVIKVFGEETTYKDMEVWSYYADKYDPGLRKWLEGMKAGVRKKGYDINYLDLVLLTVYPAQMWCRPDAPYPDETGVKSSLAISDKPTAEGYHSCHAFAATGSATKDGKPIVSISKMVPIETMHSLILIAFPDEGYSFIANPYAGAIVQNSGMNSSGFAWVLTAQFGPPAWGVVTEVYFHYLNQYCKLPIEAYEYLEETPRAGVTGAFVTSDATGNISVFESMSHVFATRVPGDAGETAEFLVQTNHLINPSLQGHNLPPYIDLMVNSYSRYATAWEYVKAAAEKGEIDFDFAKKMYQSDDWYNPDTNKWHYNEPESPNVLNNFPESVTQSIFFPSDLIAYFQVGTPSGIGLPGGATGEYVKLQLADDPVTVTESADKAAFEFYSEARNLFAKELNRNAPYLTFLVAQSIRGMLDEAMIEYERGMDRAGFAYLAEIEGRPVNEQVALWSEALTHYAKAQLYSQMAATRLMILSSKYMVLGPVT